MHGENSGANDRGETGISQVSPRSDNALRPLRSDVDLMGDLIPVKKNRVCAGMCGFPITPDDEATILQSGEIFHPACLTFVNSDPSPPQGLPAPP